MYWSSGIIRFRIVIAEPSPMHLVFDVLAGGCAAAAGALIASRQLREDREGEEEVASDAVRSGAARAQRPVLQPVQMQPRRTRAPAAT